MRDNIGLCVMRFFFVSVNAALFEARVEALQKTTSDQLAT
jgi:hypothetical protein